MKTAKLTMAAAVVTLLAGSQAHAQRTAAYGLQLPARQTAYAYDGYYDQDPPSTSPSDVPAVAAPAASEGSACPSCDSSCEEPAAEACKLFDCCFLKRYGLEVAGWTAQGFTWNPDRPSDNFNGPVTWSDRANEYQLNQQWLYMQRATNTDGSGWDLGGRVDMLYGTDFRFTTAAGLEDNWNNRAFYGLAMPQLFAEVAYNDLKVKMGHFLSPVGYFAVPTTANFFNTLPYTFQYGEPFTHTGMLATYNATDNFVIGSGLTRGWDNFDNSGNPHLGYLGTATWTGAKGNSLALVIVWSNEPNQNLDFTSRYLHTLVYSTPLTENLTYVGQSDFGTQTNALVNGKSAQWYGLNQYLLLKRSNSMTWGLGFEWFRDEDGFRVGQLLPSIGSPNARGVTYNNNNLAGGFAGNFYQITLGPQWRPGGNANLMIRPNMRWDWYQGKHNATGQLPYDNGTDHNQWIWGTDVVLSW
jgi:Putative beta-barrel porin-2, OmpL-like. bbp2